MANSIKLLYKHEFPVNDKIDIVIPTVGDIIDNEDIYYGIVSMLTAAPIDYMLQLEDVGVDFTQINDFELFLLLFSGLREMDTSLVFKDLDLTHFRIEKDEENDRVIVRSDIDDITIDRMVHAKIALVVRTIHGFEKNIRKPGNNDAKQYMLKRAREKAMRKRRKKESSLEQQIIALVNTEQFKYDFDSVRNLTIYQFNESVKQIQKKIDYDHKMFGIYTGNIDPKKLNQDDLNWLIH